MSKGMKQPPGLLSQEVAAVLRGQLARKKLTQQELATATGISTSQLSMILNGTKHADLEQLDRMCYAVGLKLADVVKEASGLAGSRFAESGWSVDPLV